MFRISAELVANSRAFYNPLRERELDLRANKLVAIENLGTMMDQFDTLDMANNEIKQLGNFPRMKRLTNLVLANNHISLVDGDNLETSLPNLRTLILTNNKIATFARVDAIAKLRSLEFLALTDNPVCRRPKYRLYAIHRMPTVKVLDFRKVAPAERERAAALFASAEGRAMLGAVAKGEEAATIDLSALRAGSAASDSAKAAAKLKRRRIAAAIAAATTSEEVDRLQLQLQSGIVPAPRAKRPATGPAASTSDAKPTKKAKKMASPKPTQPVAAPAAAAPKPKPKAKAKAPTPPAPAAPAPAASAPAVVAPVVAPAVAMLTKKELSAKRVAELRALLDQRGLSTTGKKANLVTRLLKAQQEGEGAAPAAAAAAPAEAAAGAVVAAAPAGDALPSAKDLKRLKNDELRALLEARGLSSKGKKADLVKRLVKSSS